MTEVVRLDLLSFELRRGHPTAIAVLVRRLGAIRTLRLLISFLRRARTDPFRSLGPAVDRSERYTRRMLRPLLLLDASLATLELDAATKRSLLRELVGRTGAAYVRDTLEHPTPSAWRAMSEGEKRGWVGRIISRFENVRADVVQIDDLGLGFDVRFCWFHDLCGRLGRSDLAPLFCEADAVFFGDPLVPLRLTREETLASGDPRCSFRFAFR